MFKISYRSYNKAKYYKQCKAESEFPTCTGVVNNKITILSCFNNYNQISINYSRNVLVNLRSNQYTCLLNKPFPYYSITILKISFIIISIQNIL